MTVSMIEGAEVVGVTAVSLSVTAVPSGAALVTVAVSATAPDSTSRWAIGYGAEAVHTTDARGASVPGGQVIVRPRVSLTVGRARVTGPVLVTR